MKKKKGKEKIKFYSSCSYVTYWKGSEKLLRKSEKVIYYFICYLINVSKICQKNNEIIIITSSNQSAFHRICSVKMENWVV